MAIGDGRLEGLHKVGKGARHQSDDKGDIKGTKIGPHTGIQMLKPPLKMRCLMHAETGLDHKGALDGRRVGLKVMRRTEAFRMLQGMQMMTSMAYVGDVW